MIKSQDSLSISIQVDFLGLLDNTEVILKKWSITKKERPNFFIEIVNIQKLKL